MTKSTQNLLLYIAESLVETLRSDSEQVGDTEQVRIAGKRVEAMGRYLQARGTGPGYMKMTRSEFLSIQPKDENYDLYLDKADEIESEGGFLSE
jgi:hypothetical protein